MTAFLLYILRSGLYLAVFYAFYMLVMRRTTFFRLNRIALLAGSVICAVLPLLRVRTTHFLAEAGPLSIVGTGEAAADSTSGAFSWASLLAALYIAGIVSVVVTTVISAIRLHRKTAGGERTQTNGFKTVVMDEDIPSFTCGKTIYIGRKDLDENPVIFAHETMHVKNRHYLDLFLFRVVQIVWWWNPLVWIMRTELGLLHEYEADEGVINKGIDATQYQLLLVRKAVGEQRFALASGFQHAQLKNRINMMFKPSSKGWMRLSYLAILPLLAILVYSCNPSKKQQEPQPAAATESSSSGTKAASPSEDVTKAVVSFSDVEVKPSFKGGDANEFAKWVMSEFKYPQAAIDAGVQGRVLVQFTINTDGTMGDVEVVRSVSPELDAEALRVVTSCTEKWTPGMQNGKPVPVTFTMPINFQLR